eukprot:TRINITY_DN46434_c0_g1_i1.p1 TRINITY_DN46434_c0_g1~~TRINITY_DN46434_c0_g1_i1.p1  ORF type:complete len:213 (+),score=10.19 TRINITY_DN46434_c0_g1_i1:88-639(+)
MAAAKGWLLDAPIKKSKETRRNGGKPIGKVYDYAINATHEWTNGVMRSQLDCWHDLPNPADRQRILHTTSHIIDTNVRQKAARFLSQWAENKHRADLAGPPRDAERVSLRLSHNGTWQPVPRNNSEPSLRGRPYLPPTVTAHQWDLATQPPPPRWSGPPWAAAAAGPLLWAGATLPAARRTIR